MSVVLVIRKENKAVIAADSQLSIGGTLKPNDVVRNRKKIYQLGSSFIATTGSSVHSHVLRSAYRTHQKKFDFSGADAVFETFRGLHDILKEEYFMNPEEDSDQEYESNQFFGVICNSSGIFHFQSYREVEEIDCFWAEGSGMELAIGALEALYETDQEIEEIARRAVEVACKYEIGCGLPVQSHVVELVS